MKTATINVPSFKITIPLSAAALPQDLVPPDGPAGEPMLDLVLEGGSLTVRAKINGKNYRRMMKQVVEVGPERMAVALQGTLRPPAKAGEPFVLESAGFQAVVKPEPAKAEPPQPGATGEGQAPPR